MRVFALGPNSIAMRLNFTPPALATFGWSTDVTHVLVDPSRLIRKEEIKAQLLQIREHQYVNTFAR